MTVINTNLSAVQARESMRSTGLKLATAMERLSSGVRINSARDDAAGLAISTRMTAEIRGIAAAVRNANDGISLTQTAEGGLGQISDSLQRIRELAVQSANAGNNASDRQALHNEASQLVAEIDRVANNANFNGIKLLDGTFQGQPLQVGAGNSNSDRITVSVASARASSLGVGSASSYSASLTSSVGNAAPLAPNALSINGFLVGAAGNDGVSYAENNASGIAKAAAINMISGSTGVVATAKPTSIPGMPGATLTGFNVAVVAGDVKINGVDIGGIAVASDADQRGSQVAAAVNAISGQTGVTAAYTAANGVTLTAADGRNITVSTSANAGANMKNTGLGAGSTVTRTTAAVTAAIADGAVTINGVPIGAVPAGASDTDRGTSLVAAINAKSAETGVTATLAGTAVNLSQTVAGVGRIVVGGTGAITGLGAETITSAANTATAHSVVALSSTSPAGITVAGLTQASLDSVGLTNKTVGAITSTGAGISSLDLSTIAGSQSALTTLDSALNTITNQRAALGAYQNRLTASIANLETTSMNLSASRSRILDTDYASETTNLAKAQIISQASTAMLAQANQSAQGVMALLK